MHHVKSNCRSHLRVVLLAFLLIIPVLFTFVQANFQAPSLQWKKTYGPYWSYDVIQTSDGGYAIAGQNATLGSHGYNYYEPSLIKTDSKGELQWRTVIPDYGWAVSVVQTKDLGYAVGCNPNGLLVKLDSDGNIQWKKTFDLTTCYLIQISDGGYVIAGSEHNTTNNGYNARLIKTDENGNLLWNKTFHFGFITLVTSFIQTKNGGYAFSGDTDWFAKTDANGNLLWNQTYNLPVFGQNVNVNAIVNTNDGGYVLAGFAANQAGAFLIKTDAQGNIQWSNHYENSSYESIVQVSDGGYVAAGVDQSGSYALIKMDYQGNVLWNASIGGNPSSVILTKDNSYVVTGTISSPYSTSTNIFLEKYAPESVNPTPTNEEPSSFSTTVAVVIAVIIVVVVITILLVYFKKRRHFANTGG
jgi:hypothetical protein